MDSQRPQATAGVFATRSRSTVRTPFVFIRRSDFRFILIVIIGMGPESKLLGPFLIFEADRFELAT
jgi:hypothetical protein